MEEAAEVITGTAISMATATAMETKTIAEEEWDDYPEMALSTRRHLLSPLVCVYVDR